MKAIRIAAAAALLVSAPLAAQEQACNRWDMRVAHADSLSASSRYRVDAPDGTTTARNSVDTGFRGAMDVIPPGSPDSATVRFAVAVFCAEWVDIAAAAAPPETVLVASADSAAMESVATWAIVNGRVLVSAQPGDSIWPGLDNARFVAASAADVRPLIFRAELPPVPVTIMGAYLDGNQLTADPNDSTRFPLSDVFTLSEGVHGLVVDYRLWTGNVAAAGARFSVVKGGGSVTPPGSDLPVATGLETWSENSGRGIRWSGPTGVTWRVTRNGDVSPNPVNYNPTTGFYWHQWPDQVTGELCVQAVEGATLGEAACLTV